MLVGPDHLLEEAMYLGLTFGVHERKVMTTIVVPRSVVPRGVDQRRLHLIAR